MANGSYRFDDNGDDDNDDDDDDYDDDDDDDDDDDEHVPRALQRSSRRAPGGLPVGLPAGMGISVLNSVFLTHNICGPLRKAAEDISWKNRADVDGGWGVGGAWLPEGSWRALGGLRVLRAGMGYKCMKLSLLNSVFLTHKMCGPLQRPQ